MAKKWRIVVMLAGVLLLGSGQAWAASDPIVRNGSFEERDGDSAAAWTTRQWSTGTGTTSFTLVRENARSGQSAVRIEAGQADDARWVQTVTVLPDTVYRLSGWIKAEGVGAAGRGANLSVEESMSATPDLYDTDGKWTYVELYGKTGSDQRQVTVSARIGFFGGTNTGTAWFDDIALTEAGDVPPGAVVVSFQDAASIDPLPAEKPPQSGQTTAAVWFAACLFILVFALLYRRMQAGEQTLAASDNRGSWHLWAIIAAGLAVRLIAAYTSTGYEPDSRLFRAWADHAYANGLAGFYDNGLFADYPPGYMYVLYLIGGLLDFFQLDGDTGASRILIRLPAMLADTVIAYGIYRTAGKRFSASLALGLAALYALNPASILISAAWGQADSLLMLVAAAGIGLAARGRLPAAAAAFALAVLIKPQAVIFAPLLLLPLIRRKSITLFLRCAASGAAVFLLLALPFTWGKPGGPLWLIELYTGTLSQYPYASLNAFNFFALVGGNWLPVSGAFLRIPYAAWSGILLAASMAFSVYVWIKAKKEDGLFYLIATLAGAAFFLFAVKMHERYLFYAVLPAMLGFVHTRDRRLLLLYGGFSVTVCINALYLLLGSWAGQYFIPQRDPLLVIVSGANLAMFAVLVKTAWDISRGKTQPMKSRNPASGNVQTPVSPEPRATRLTRREILLLSLLTAAYAAVALFQLGSPSAPQTYWKPEQAGIRFVADLGRTERLGRVNSFAGLGDGVFRLQTSLDGELWEEGGTIRRDGSNVFAWDSVMVGRDARYLRVEVMAPGARLLELALYGGESDRLLKIQRLQTEKSGPSEGEVDRLFDEQSRAAYRKTFYNSTYFDEIYYARTGFEHLHAMEPYETTHPPLGKLLIAAGIGIFGMNPFGWRIGGAIAGIAMIPVVYLFAKRFFGRTKYAGAAALLMAFDFLTFVQSRIALIDALAVLFILLMFYFMLRYFQMNFYRDGIRRTLVPLGWCGLFFGLGAATKWISLYAGCGLALLLFYSLWERYRECPQTTGAKGPDARPALFRKHASVTILWCLPFFVLLPAAVYFLSYIPFLNVPGPGHEWEDVIRYQVHMFEYHRSLVASHPFSSPWYDWPLMIKPVWYYAAAEPPPGSASIIVALGNPAVWWTGIAGAAAALWIGAKNRDRRILFLAVALGSVYLPWMFVARLTFLYHFFAAVPFVILSILYVFFRLEEATTKRWVRWSLLGYLAAAAVLFLLFYPVLSGLTVNRAYVEGLKWMPSWVF